MQAMDDLAFCSYAFGSQYVQQQHRLKDSIKEIYPKANFVWYTGTDLPPGSKSFMDSLYGFKPHLVQEALNRGYKRVICLDPAMILTGKIDGFIKYPMIAVKDDSVLHNVVSDKTLNYYRLTRLEIKENEWHLVGGSFYYFDFYHQVAMNIFTTWLTSEKQGLFGSQQEAASEQLQGHRYDETLMALAMYFNGVEPLGADQVGYCLGEDSIWQKKHFK